MFPGCALDETELTLVSSETNIIRRTGLSRNTVFHVWTSPSTRVWQLEMGWIAAAGISGTPAAAPEGKIPRKLAGGDITNGLRVNVQRRNDHAEVSISRPMLFGAVPRFIVSLMM